MNTVISVSFAAAIAFQLPLLIRLLATMGIVTSEGMRQYRKVAVAALLIFAAIITPPDVVSQVLIFVPCYVLYEYGIGIAARIEAARAKEEAEYEAAMAAEKAKAEDEAKRKAEEEAAKKEQEEVNEEDADEETADEENTDDTTSEDTPEESTTEESKESNEDEGVEEELEVITSPLGTAMMPKFPEKIGEAPKKRKIVYSVAKEEPTEDNSTEQSEA